MLCECGQHEATVHEVIITTDKEKVERHLCASCAQKQGMSSDPYIPINELMSSANYIMGQMIKISTDQMDPNQLDPNQLDPTDELESDDDSDSAKSYIHLPVQNTDTPSVNPSPPQPPPAQPQVARAQTAHACLGCGQSFAQFKESGFLGCSACYQVFEERIGPMIERAHEGGCNHVGKIPRRALCECKDEQDSKRISMILGDIRQREERLETLRKQLHKSIKCEDFEQAAMIRDELTRVSTIAQAHAQIEIQPTQSDRDQAQDPQVSSDEQYMSEL